MFEKRLERVAPKPLLVNGGTDGKVTVTDTSGFKVKQQVIIFTLNNITERYEVKRIENSTEMYVGPIGSKIQDRSNLSHFTTILASAIEAPEQPRPNIPEQEVERLTYEEEPTVARRVINVDQYGNKYTSTNRVPVDPQGQQMTIMNNLLAMQVAGISPNNFLINNDGFFIFDNAGNFIKV